MIGPFQILALADAKRPIGGGHHGVGRASLGAELADDAAAIIDVQAVRAVAFHRDGARRAGIRASLAILQARLRLITGHAEKSGLPVITFGERPRRGLLALQ